MKLRLGGGLNIEFSSNCQFFRYELEKVMLYYVVGYCVWVHIFPVGPPNQFYNRQQR